jgi:PhoPQ-activated pathogenicity-related protein
MVKSAVKAMDALQEFSESHLPKRVKSFVITGASKRGWTSWLTPVVDERVVGTAPIVIDVLNFLAQTKHQKETWGKYSEQIIDYTSKGLVKTSAEEETPRERQLRLMMDPYTYRKRLTLPKLMIVGTNDRYWVVDAMQLYWNDLEGPKYVLEVPNAGHDLGEGRNHALNTLSIFFRHIAGGTPLPALKWQTTEKAGTLSLEIESDPKPVGVKLWKATMAGMDFREAKWTSEPLEIKNPHTQALVAIPSGEQHIAIFGEIEFKAGERTYSLTTMVYCR